MNFILVDDDAAALDILAQKTGERSSDLDLTNLTLVWANRGQLTSDLVNTANRLSVQGIEVVLLQVATVADFALQIDSVSAPTVLVSDLNMRSIALLTTHDPNPWIDPNGVLKRSIEKYLSSQDNILMLHSSSGNIETVKKKLGPENPRLIALSHNLQQQQYSEGASEVIDEIVWRIGATRLEQLWSSPNTTDWFSNGNVPHAWTKSWMDTSKVPKDYIETIGKALAVGDIPDSWWTESFHESLKGIVGAHFCGSGGANNVTPDRPLRLGGVAVIALLAHHQTCKEGTSLFTDFFKKWHVDLAKRPFLLGFERDEARRSALTLWWLFSHCFSKEERGSAVNVKVLEDGFEIVFDWDTRQLFSQGAQLLAESGNDGSAAAQQSRDDGGAMVNPSNSSQALLAVLSALVVHPGRVLPGHYTIRIQAVIS